MKRREAINEVYENMNSILADSGGDLYSKHVLEKALQTNPFQEVDCGPSDERVRITDMRNVGKAKRANLIKRGLVIPCSKALDRKLEMQADYRELEKINNLIKSLIAKRKELREKINIKLAES